MFNLVVGSIVALGGIACIVFANQLVAKMRHDSPNLRLQKPWQMRMYGVVMLVIGGLFVLSELS